MAVSLSADVRNRRKGRDNPRVAKARKWAPPPGVDAERLEGRRLPDRRAARRGVRWLGSLPTLLNRAGDEDRLRHPGIQGRPAGAGRGAPRSRESPD